MFGQGNGASNPGAFQQRPPGAPQNFQPGAQGPVHPVMQQPTIQAGGPVYQRAPPMHPQSYVQQAPQSAVPNIGPYVQAPQPQLGHIQPAYQYPPGQSNVQQFPQFGARNGYQAPPLRPTTLPPPHILPPPSHGLQRPLLFQPPPPPLPATSLNQSIGQNPPPSSSSHHTYQEFRSPLAPPSASSLPNSSQCESSAQPVPSNSCSAFTNHHPAPSLPAPRPPSTLPNNDVKDTSSATVFDAFWSVSVPNSSDCPEPAEMNARGAADYSSTSHHNIDLEGFECRNCEGEMTRSVVDGSYGDGSDSVLSRPKAASVSQFDASTSGERLCSPGDSDMDMEDDITNCDEDLGSKDQEDKNPERLVETEEIYVHDQLRGRDGSVPLSPSTNTPSRLISEDGNSPRSPTVALDHAYGGKAMELSTSSDITLSPVDGTVDPGVPSGNVPGQLANIEIPIKLLQDHVSDDTSEKPSIEDIDDMFLLPSATHCSAELNKNGDPSLVRDGESSHPCATEEASKSLQTHVTETVDASETHLKVNVENSSEVGKAFEQAKLDERKELLGFKSQPSSPVKDHIKPDEITSKNVKAHKKESTAVCLKVDEFGRLARDVTSDSDSEGCRYNRKRARRGRSRSISPSDRRRRWRSPLGRRKNRSRSRSWSPLKRRSRSPGYRRDNDFDGETRRKDKRQTSICFNYQAARCHRGSSCRYLHHDSGRNDSSRNYKSNYHHLESTHGGNDSKFKESSKVSLEEVPARGHDDARRPGAQTQKSSKIVGTDTPSDSSITNKYEVSHGINLYAQQEYDSHLLVTQSEKSETSRALSVQVEEVLNACVAKGEDTVEVPGNVKYQKSAKTAHPYDASSSRSQVQLKEVDSSAQMFSNASSEVQPASTPLNGGQRPHHMDQFPAPISSQYQSLGTSNQLAPIRPPVSSIPLSSQPWSQPAHSESLSHQLPSGINGMQISQGMTGLHIPQPQRNFSMMQPNSCPPVDPHGGISSYQLPIPNQLPQFSAPPNPLWFNLPPPPPRPSLYPYVPSGNMSASGHLAPQFEQNQQHPNISGPYSSYLHSSVGEYPQQSYHPPTEVHRPPMTFQEHRLNSFLMENLQSQQAEGPDVARDDHTSVQGLIPSKSHVQPNPSAIGPPPIKRSALPGDNYNLSSPSNYTHQEPSLHNIQNSAPGDPMYLGPTGKSLPGSGGGQYDPLYDSFDKSSNSLVKSDQEQKQYSTCDSDNLLRRGASHKILDVEETNRKKEIEAIASLTTSDNDEFGETADAEVGVVENESFSDPADMPYRGSDVEINQRSPGKKKKNSADSRSMKLFKSAIANFVKEVLKPSWRQGNMSKEAFKTIVKKTVEKVSGAIKEHRYPKSQAKINHYIDTSQRKLTKLVMGYVDKYVKV